MHALCTSHSPLATRAALEAAMSAAARHARGAAAPATCALLPADVPAPAKAAAAALVVEGCLASCAQRLLQQVTVVLIWYTSRARKGMDHVFPPLSSSLLAMHYSDACQLLLGGCLASCTQRLLQQQVIIMLPLGTSCNDNVLLFFQAVALFVYLHDPCPFSLLPAALAVPQLEGASKMKCDATVYCT